MKKIFCIIIILLVSVFGSTTHADDFLDFPFVIAKGNAKSEVSPNIATVSFYVEQFDEKAANSLEVVKTRCAELIDFLETLNIEKEDIIAYDIRKKTIREEKDYDDLKILGYEVSRRFLVKLRNLNEYEKLINKLLSLNNVSYRYTTFDRTDRKEIETELIIEAGKNAREEAANMAKGFGVELGSVFAISQEGFPRISTIFSDEPTRYAAEARGNDVFFIPSTIVLENSVTVIFKLKEE